jgi:transketolase
VSGFFLIEDYHLLHFRQRELDAAEENVSTARQELEEVKAKPLAPYVPEARTSSVKLEWNGEIEASSSTDPDRVRRLSQHVDDTFWKVVDEQGQTLESKSSLFHCLV